MDSITPSELPAEVTPLPGVSASAATAGAATTSSASPRKRRRPYERKPTVRSRAISQALRIGVRPFVHYAPNLSVGIRTARSTVDAASLLMRPTQRVRIEPLIDPQVEKGRGAAAERRPIVGEWVTSRGDGSDGVNGAILYLHGGAYIVCSPRTHRPITSRLAVDTGLPVLVPRYRLAPEHPFPAPLEDALAAYKWLMARGVPGSRIVIAGDSAGGHLAACLTGEICRTGLPGPAGTVLFSPWVDLTCELSTAEHRNVRDPYISAFAARRVARLVVGPAGFDDPRLALLTRAWTNTPPFLIQVGGSEVLRPEAEAFANALVRAGGQCELQVWNGQMHVFQILNRVLPEASSAMRETARFIRDALAAAPAQAEAVA
ncbi:alpha/beta hydrolase [Actinomadura barringtoniae]|uniref:Alpha/beta hydrolase n=1 Tax=Actinomadura barringtoniae TaxID=1427535 RepID=A0A939TCQ2_9ACTN|nr:alpha/beta hydrolase [Actinomadura barringtoniae]MBO2451495.1 alpha/beta hydrolase [Actinomadura barringtoniae]